MDTKRLPCVSKLYPGPVQGMLRCYYSEARHGRSGTTLEVRRLRALAFDEQPTTAPRRKNYLARMAEPTVLEKAVKTADSRLERSAPSLPENYVKYMLNATTFANEVMEHTLPPEQ